MSQGPRRLAPRIWQHDWLELSGLRRSLDRLLAEHRLLETHPTDFRRWTRPGLEDEISARGFTLIDTLPGPGPLAWTLMFRLIAYREVLRKIPVFGPLLLLPLAVIMNVRAKLEDACTPAAIR